MTQKRQQNQTICVIMLLIPKLSNFIIIQLAIKCTTCIFTLLHLSNTLTGVWKGNDNYIRITI